MPPFLSFGKLFLCSPDALMPCFVDLGFLKDKLWLFGIAA